MPIFHRHVKNWLAPVLTGLLLCISAQAQTYPVKPIKMIVPFPAGGTPDIVARIVAQRMSEAMGQPVVVDNRGGRGARLVPIWWPSRPQMATRC